MITIQNHSDTVIIVVHEIYGINQHIKDFSLSLSEKGCDVICPNLLAQEAPFDYTQEEKAYHSFIEQDFTNAANKVKELLLDVENKYKNIYIVGFSVGSTIAWMCSEDDSLNGIVGYYGSRIRNYTEIIPRCPAMLFFPEQEASFNVTDLIASLKGKGIEIYQLNGQHGFSDPYSAKYHKKSAIEAYHKTIDFIVKHRMK